MSAVKEERVRRASKFKANSALPRLGFGSEQADQSVHHSVSGKQRPREPHSSESDNIVSNMTTRRIVTQEKTHLDQDELKPEPKSNISPAVPGWASLHLPPQQPRTNNPAKIRHSETPRIHLRHDHITHRQLLHDPQLSIRRYVSHRRPDNALCWTAQENMLLTWDRQRDIRRRPGSAHGQRRPNWLRHRRLPRRQRRARSRRSGGEEVTMMIRVASN